MTVTTLASISLLALVVTAAPLPRSNDASQIERQSLSVQNTAQSLLQSRLGQAPKCSGCEQAPEPHVHVASASAKESHDILADLGDVDAVKDAVPIDFPHSQQDENKVYDIQNESEAGSGHSSKILAESTLGLTLPHEASSVPASEGSGDIVNASSKSPGLSNRQPTPDLVSMALGATVGSVFGLLFFKYILRPLIATSASDLESLPTPEETDNFDDGPSAYSDEKEQLIMVVSQSRPSDSVPCDENEKRAMTAEYSPSEAGDSSDEDIDEKFVDAEEPPVLLVDTSVPETPQIVVQQHPDPELLPLPVTLLSTPFSTPPPTPPRSPLRRPLQMREANLSSPIARPAWSQRAADAPSLGLANFARASASPVMRSISSSPVMRPGTPVMAIPGAFAPEGEHEKHALDASSRSRAYRAPVPELDLAFALQLRPGLGLGSDPAWLVRFLMAMFGWMTVFIGNGAQPTQGPRRTIL